MALLSLVEMLPSAANKKQQQRNLLKATGQLTDCTGSPHQGQSREALAAGGARGTRVALLWVFREGGAACSGRGRSQEKDEGLQAQDAGRQEAAHHWCHSAWARGAQVPG